jgi:hypothetical protein
MDVHEQSNHLGVLFLESLIGGETPIKWCPGAESNHRHADFQSAALPTELPGHYLVHDTAESGFQRARY